MNIMMVDIPEDIITVSIQNLQKKYEQFKVKFYFDFKEK